MGMKILTALLLLFSLPANQDPSYDMTDQEQFSHTDQEWKQITLGAGCFWSIEAVFSQVKGVKDATSGFAGGDVQNPTYEQVSSGSTGHAEVVQLTYDPSEISLDQLLDVFWFIHNPTTPNRQGADVGPQYRSAIFYHDEEQRRIAEASKERTGQSGLWEDPIVTEINPVKNFTPAEDYHQDYFEENRGNAYCTVVIGPKLEKFKEEFGHLVDEGFDPSQR